MGRHFLLLLEVKCCEEEKGLKEHRKKSVAQLKKHVAMMKEIFGSDEKAKKEIDKVILHTVWPNLSSKEPCDKCKGSHERFQKKPQNCRLAGQTQEPQYEEEGWHWFKEDLEEKTINEQDINSCKDPKLKLFLENKLVLNLNWNLIGLVDWSNLEKILRETLKREDKVLNTYVWLQLLKTQTTASCGALYNEMDKEFFILGPKNLK